MVSEDSDFGETIEVFNRKLSDDEIQCFDIQIKNKNSEVVKMAEKMPVESWKCGLIEMAKWENESKDGKKYYNYTLTRSYEMEEDGKKVWKSQKINMSHNEAENMLEMLTKWKLRKVKHKTDFTQKPKE